MKTTLKVALNGTDGNPYHQMGLTCNPFQQLGRAEYAAGERAIAKLGADPIKDVQQIRDTLIGFNPEFIELCVSRYAPGKMVRFDVVFDLNN